MYGLITQIDRSIDYPALDIEDFIINNDGDFFVGGAQTLLAE